MLENFNLFAVQEEVFLDQKYFFNTTLCGREDFCAKEVEVLEGFKSLSF